jgi:ligand-binding sensor domain-containing protein
MNNRDLPTVERALLEVTFPQTIPAFSQLMEDSEGNLWVRHFKMRWSTGPETWSVFAPEGYLLGTVQTPEALQVRQIGTDFIAGIWTDELDIRYLRKYALIRSTQP